MHRLQLVELLTKLGGRVALLGDVALDADVANRLTGGVIDGERGELDDPLASVLRPAPAFTARNARLGEIGDDERELLAAEVDGRGLIAELVVGVAEQLGVGGVLLEVAAIGVDDGDRLGGLDEDRAIEGEGLLGGAALGPPSFQSGIIRCCGRGGGVARLNRQGPLRNGAESASGS